jgi:hypothetical protein
MTREFIQLDKDNFAFVILSSVTPEEVETIKEFFAELWPGKNIAVAVIGADQFPSRTTP